MLQLNGEITVTSKKGSGSIFTVMFRTTLSRDQSRTKIDVSILA